MLVARRVEDQRAGGVDSGIVLRGRAGQAHVRLGDPGVAVRGIGAARREQDGAQHQIVGDDEANKQLARPYRAPFVVPEHV